MPRIDDGGISVTVDDIKDAVYLAVDLWHALKKKPSFERYFLREYVGNINVFVYQVGIRAKIPLVDLLYLELLHKMLRQGEIEVLYLFSSVDLSNNSQDRESEGEFCKNVESVFHDCSDRLHIVSTKDISVTITDVLSRGFLKMVEYVSGPEFLKLLKTTYKWNGETLDDFNLRHPRHIRLVLVIVHLVRSWSILAHLKATSCLKSGTRIGHILWETEMFKLGAFQFFVAQNPEYTLGSVLGKTLYGAGNEVIPVFEEEKTVFAFDNLDGSTRKLSEKPQTEARRYCELLSTILMENYEVTVEAKASYENGLRLLHMLRMNRPNLPQSMGKQSMMALYMLKLLQDRYAGGS